jgi:hypothetical protein
MKVRLFVAGVARFAAAVAVMAGLTTAASAETVLVDFGNNDSFRGVSVSNPDDNGNTWNSLVPGPFYADLKDTGNNTTTIDLGFSTPVGTDSFNGPAGVTSFPNPTPAEIAATDIDAAALGILGIKTAAIDFAAGPGGADNRTRFEIQGLNPALKYNLSLFGSHKFSDNDATIYTIYTDNTYTTEVASASLNVQEPGSPWLHNRDKVVTFNGIAPQASNILYMQFVGAQGSLGYLNSFSITAVPEPSAMLLVSCGLALAGCIRRR